ncbi:Spc98 family-domain-containing protein [Tirmania nivea]|nr:Spc98 family-domain-containing protein [Tirmania nivea]
MAATPVVVKQLLGQLITAVTGITPEEDPENYELCQAYAQRSIKNHTYVRTNPFEVNRRLNELEERFSIVCKDSIADALHSRREELKASNFKAKTLSLILNLSWRPVEFARLSDLEAVKKPEPPRELTWADIIGDEPLEGDIWDPMDLEHGSELSSVCDGSEISETEEDVQDQMKNVTMRKKMQDKEEEEAILPMDCFTIPVDWSHLQRLKGAQYWYVPAKVLPEQVDASVTTDKVDDLWLVSELHAIRETLFMLNCVPCSLYEVGRRTLSEGKDPYIVWIDMHKLKKKFAMRHASREGFISILGWFAERGTAINRIREFVKRKEEIPSRQSFLAALSASLSVLNQILAENEATYVTKEGNAQVISLLQLQQSLEPALRPYMTLSSIVVSLSKSSFISSAHSSEHLDLLFDSACHLQSIGCISSFEFIAKIFFQCLQTYIRPIREWMEYGEVHAQDINFFVRSSKEEEDNTITGEPILSTIWHDQFTLLKDVHGNLKAPRFVLSVANTILTTGKSVVFLKRLISYEEPLVSTSGQPELDFNTVYQHGRSDDAGLAPFDELFSSAFSEWTRKKHQSVSSKLRDVLFTNCGLWKTLAALEHIYFGADGAQLSALATAVFEKLDNVSANAGTGKRSAGGRPRRRERNNLWNDRFVLTELVQSVFSGWDFLDAKRLGVRRVAVPEAPARTNIYESKDKSRSVRQLAGIALEYALPWPLLNILKPSSLEAYKLVFILLLQLRRGKYVIEHLRLQDGGLRTCGTGRKGNDTLVEQLYLHLRHRALWFVNLMTMYVTYHVLKPNIEEMTENMRKARDVDEMVNVHDVFVEKVTDRALLSDRMSKFHNAILSLLDICIDFADFHNKYLSSINILTSTLPPASSGTCKKLQRPNDSDSDLDLDLDHHGGVPLFTTSPPRKPPPASALMPPPPRPPFYRRPSKRPRRYSTAPPTPSSSSEGEEDLETIVGESETDNDSIMEVIDDNGRLKKPATLKELEDYHAGRLGELKVEWEEWLDTLRNGLKGVSRAGVLPHLEVLAEGLEGNDGSAGWLGIE